jgi:protein-S-isoprenylcysteine O-methyltransferase Ste14
MAPRVERDAAFFFPHGVAFALVTRMSSPIPLQHALPRAWHVLRDSVHTAAGISGIFLSQFDLRRAAVSLTILVFATSAISRSAEMSPGSALLAFGVAAAVRHGFAFASFSRNGIAARLKARLGSELGLSVHESAAILLLFAQRLSFLQLLLATANAPSSALDEALVSSGMALVALGVAVSVWATRIIGVDRYYYSDLFGGPTHVRLERRGPYALFTNPIYGVGQLAAYGAALIVLSPIGIWAAVLNQVLLYVFNAAVEQPHVRAGALDTALCNSLSRTVLDPPPLLDAGPGRRSLPPRRVRVRSGNASAE